MVHECHVRTIDGPLRASRASSPVLAMLLFAGRPGPTLVSIPLLAMLALPSRARASPAFPSVVKEVVGVSAGCATCHVESDAEPGKLTLFGASLSSRGAVAKDENALRAALDRLRSDRFDSDGDGTSDIDEIRRSSDPNVPDRPLTEPIAISYGACNSTPEGRRDMPCGVLVLGCLAALARRLRSVAPSLPPRELPPSSREEDGGLSYPR